MLLAVEWRGKPVWVVNRTKEMLDLLAKHDDKLTDAASENTAQQPEYCKNPTRSIKPQYLIVVGICTHLGCSPTYRKEVAPADLGADWAGGWFCPLPRFPLRSGRARVQRFSGADQPGHSAA
jgi:ubiquinol-cytochrome c reductase iron-sulfur subunit